MRLTRVFFPLLLVFSFLLLGKQEAVATHNRAGEIIYKRLNQFTYEITVITYTKESSSAADRCFLEIRFGDELDPDDVDTIYRINGLAGNNCQHYGEVLGNDVKMNLYKVTHVYPGAGNYTISVEDPNRNGDVVNIPNSIDVVFYIETKLSINPFLGANNSPQLLNPPIDDACLHKKFIHNPGAFDVDGDSLVFKLVFCKGQGGNNISGYSIPATASIDPVTGDLIWLDPTESGEFNFAILIEEYKIVNGVARLVGTVLRDMQVTVKTCQNNPPVIQDLTDTCVVAGSTLVLNIKATDPDPDLVTLTSTGSPYLLTINPADFDSVLPANPVIAQFKWNTDCKHIKKSDYIVYFKAKDNDPNDPLVDYKSLKIRIIGPKTPNLNAQPIGTSIKLNWDVNPCNNAVSYKIYRRNSANTYTPDHCETGIPAFRGYALIATNSGFNNTNYTDNDNGAGLNSGVDYCYRVVAVYPDGSESIVSDEVCASLLRDIPIITNASVTQTSTTAGEVYVRWSKPVVDPVLGLDTNAFAGPYEFRVYHSSPSSPSSVFVSKSALYFANLNDTIALHQNINTETEAHTYRVEFYSNGTLVGTTQAAQTLFLSFVPNDNQLQLNWSVSVPWQNYKYRIYKKNNSTGLFALLDSTTVASYTDTGLVNGQSYCYYIESVGEFSVNHLEKPLYNNSQIACGTPLDKTAPCPPAYLATGDCNNFINTHTWFKPKLKCEDDVVKYVLYKSPTTNYSFTEVVQIAYNGTDSLFLEDSLTNSIAGCYVLTAVDSFGNESLHSDTVCIDNCPYYELPNVFTPNGDGKNDNFKPFAGYKFIESIDLTIYNRWGNVIYTTNDPKIGWNGINQQSNQYCPDGVYYYLCTVNQITVNGIKPTVLKGFVHLYIEPGQIPK